MEARNNHGTCWVMQVAAFARLAEDEELMEFCRRRYKEVLLPGQMAEDGSFPLELERTKPYGYSLFNLDAMATICQILSVPEDNLRSEEHTSELQSLMRISYAVFCLKKKNNTCTEQHNDIWNIIQVTL